MSPSRFVRKAGWIPLLAVLAYLPSVSDGFVYDDTLLISENAYVQDLTYWKRAFATHFWDVSRASPQADPIHYYRPLVTASYLLNWLVSENQAWAFHLTNVLLHAANTYLVLIIGSRFTRNALLGAVCALVFALHPTRAEAVTWISGRPDPLMAFFLLLAIQLIYLGRSRASRWPACLGAITCFSAALLCKEPALAAPLLLSVDSLDAKPTDRRWHLSMVALTLMLSATYLALRHLFLPVNAPSLSWTPIHALVTVTHYFERIVFPWPQTFFYQLEQLGPTGPIHSPIDVVAGGLLALGGLTLGVYAVQRDSAAFSLLLASVSFLGPLLNVFRTGSQFTAADRFLYLPLWLLAAGCCRLFAAPTARLLEPRWVRFAGAFGLLVYLTLNGVRALDFSSSSTLWNAELAVNPDNPVALRSRSAQLAADGQVASAIRDLEHSLRSESLRFHTVITPNYDTDSYARLLVLRARNLPDGASRDLRLLAADAVDRLAARTRPSRSDLLGIDWPANVESARWAALAGEEVIARHLVQITTRIDLREISTSLLDAIPEQNLHLAPNPLLVAIGEAREERFDRALRRVDTMKRRLPFMPRVVTADAIVDVEKRIGSAQEVFARSDLEVGSEKHLMRASAFAALGAYGRALIEVQKVNPSHPAMMPLYVQLLVFARLDSAALEVATRSLGPERSRIAIQSIREQLPPDLRALSTIESPTRANAEPQ